MIERINSSTNIMAFLLVAGGGVLCIWRPEIGSNIITGAFSLLAGKHLADAANAQK